MPLFGFLFQAITISLSGVMAPGPMTAATLGKGTHTPTAGFGIACGHGLFEFPLMAALLFGLGPVIAHPPVQFALFVIGAIFLVVMGWELLSGAAHQRIRHRRHAAPPVMVGILLSAGNPYFLIWWGTVGAALLLQARAFGWTGILAFALIHWLCDVIWLSFLAWSAHKGGRVFGTGFQKTLFVLCGLLLVFFGIRFIQDALRILLP